MTGAAPDAAAGLYRAGPPRWEFGEPPAEEPVRVLARELSLPPELCRILVVRGHDTPEAAKDFLRPRLDRLPPPETLADLPAAGGRILTAIDGGVPILVHGDYDVDGICAAALLTGWIRRLGGIAHAFAPHRLRDGYDLGSAGLARAREVGAGLLVTVDCGIVAHEAVQAAREAGIEVVVTDHHTPGPTLPDAAAVVNPNRADDPSGRGELCGAGVAFQLCRFLAERRGHELRDLLPDLDLVALATIADLVPLRRENRILVRYGLQALEHTRKPGLRALLEVCELTGPLQSGRIGFTLAPRINAVGRLGEPADALALLLTADPAEARRRAEAADALNRERREEDRRTLDEALELLARDFDPERDYGVVLAGEGWHPGVIGIVASRVVDRIHRPTVLVSLGEGTGRGSARSIRGFHLHEGLTRCAHLLRRFGGHAQAAGMDVDPARIPDFREAFNAVAREALDAEALRPGIRVDLEVDPGALTLQMAEYAAYMGPHGMGNPRPVLVSRELRIRGRPRVVGNGHLKLELGRNGAFVEAIGFGLAERLPPEELGDGPLDAAYQLTVNEYRGRRTPQMRLLDLRPAGGAP